MDTRKFEIETADGHTIRGTAWAPAGECRGVIQVFHGLGEHHARYERFARAAVARDIAVVAHDHRGHGPDTPHLGHFADKKGWPLTTADGLQVNDWISEQFTGLPIILLGHSMGSYIAQYFAIRHYSRIKALALSGSTWPGKALVFTFYLLAQIESLRLGKRGESALLAKLGFGDFNKPFEPARTPLDWLSRDEAEVDKYIADPLCGGPYSCRLWIDLMAGLNAISSDKQLNRIPSDLPILLTSGADDPVGGDKGIGNLALHYAQTGHGRLTVKLYPDGRHEMLNETNRDEFTSFLLDWVDRQLPAIARA